VYSVDEFDVAEIRLGGNSLSIIEQHTNLLINNSLLQSFNQVKIEDAMDRSAYLSLQDQQPTGRG